MIPRRLLIGLGILVVASILLTNYAFRLKRRVEDPERLRVYTRPVAPPGGGPTQPVTLWVANDVDGTIRSREVQASLPSETGERAKHVLRLLFAAYLERRSPHPIGDGSDVKDVYKLSDDTLVIDLNAPFADAHRSGVFVEELTVLSMLESLSANVPKVTRVKFLVDGKERETLAGHADLHSYYDVGIAAQAAKGLQ
jgi:Sporulation and spore germination